MADLSEIHEPIGASSNTMAERPRSPTTHVRTIVVAVALAALATFSFILVWRVGHRGLFMLDESIVFDGAWRVYQGQVPYRDFVMPFGPITFWLQALMFRGFGVDFSTLVLSAAALSVIATLVVVRLIWRLTSGSAGWSLLGGLLTAVWYQAPFGIPWMEQTAFLFDLFALLLVVEARFAGQYGVVCFVLAGAASTCAVLSKQNAGGLFVVVCLGCLCLPWRANHPLRAVVSYATGGLAAALAFAGWLLLRSKPQVFLHYWFSLSAGIGWQRVAFWKILGTLTFQSLLGTSIVLFIASSAVGLAALLWSHSRASVASGERARVALAGWLCLALPQFHSFFQLTTNNDPPNNNAFVGVCAALAAWLLARCLSGLLGVYFRGPGGEFELVVPRRALQVWLIALVTVALYSVGEGITIAWTRNVQEFEGASFTEHVALARASGLLWGEPTRITPQFCARIGEICKISGDKAGQERPFELLHKRDFESIAVELQRRHQNFFVFPDATILYGLLGRPSPQPVLYFHPGQSYALADQAGLDRQIVSALQNNSVELIVLERASYMGTHKLLALFPELKGWLDRNFRLAAEFGNYRLFERNPR